MYTVYVNNYTTAFETIQECSKDPKVAQFLDDTKKIPECKFLDIQSYLSILFIDITAVHSQSVMPIQRIPRYVLLLQDLFNQTDSTHPDYSNLQKALQKMKEVAGYVNEKKREAENMNQVASIQKFLVGFTQNLCEPHRRYVSKACIRYVTEPVCRYARAFSMK